MGSVVIASRFRKMRRRLHKLERDAVEIVEITGETAFVAPRFDRDRRAFKFHPRRGQLRMHRMNIIDEKGDMRNAWSVRRGVDRLRAWMVVFDKLQMMPAATVGQAGNAQHRH